MKRFYLTLPSNSSMGTYPQNTAAKYSTKLPHSIELEGDWEVGLSEIACQNDFYNVVGEMYYITLTKSPINRKFIVESGIYTNVRQLLDKINEMMHQHAVEFSFDHRSQLVHVVNASDLKLKMSPALSEMLGFEVGKWYTGRGSAQQSPQLDKNPNNLFVYCDIVEPVIVGDVKAPLLRIVEIKQKRLSPGYSHVTLTRPLYVPVQKKSFDTIEILIATDEGFTAPFKDGKSYVVLEFQRIGLLEKLI